MKSIVHVLKKLDAYADLKLLVFLLLFLNVKIEIKLFAIILIYALQFNFNFGFRLKDSRLPLFYPLCILLALLGGIFFEHWFSPAYGVVLATGVAFWLCSILAIHQVKLTVESRSPDVIHHTLFLLFLINALFSLFNLAHIIFEIHTLNPYRYQGLYQKYFMSTGDYIKGISFDTSTTNSVLNAFGVLYFLDRKKPFMLLLCMAVLLFTVSNFINLVIAILLVLLFLFRSDRFQKSMISICLFFLIIFMVKISPQNDQYIAETFQAVFHLPKPHVEKWVRPIPLRFRPDSELNSEQRREKIASIYLDSVGYVIYKRQLEQRLVVKLLPDVPAGVRPVIPEPSIHSATFQSRRDTNSPQQTKLIDFIAAHRSNLPVSATVKEYPGLPHPGKMMALLQTLHYFAKHPFKILFGQGAGNFSSKLAFRASCLGFAGSYPSKYTYINPDFLSGHLDLYLFYFSKAALFHSLTNSPYSVYDQLLAEYGILGVLVFLVFYLGFFLRQPGNLSYGLILLSLMMAVFLIDYWFEQLSVVLILELLLFLDVKERSTLKIAGA